MRITTEEKNATRQRILASALELFRTRGFEAATTRDLARAAEIAVGTLFNYFESKEAIVAFLAEDALAKARADFTSQPFEGALEEELFSLAVSELRQLKPLRKFIAPVLETALSPLATVRSNGDSQPLRVEHLEIVARIARKHGVADVSPVAMQVYWALYTGALAFWAGDKSPKQEDTLALLDQSFRMFAAWVRSAPGGPPEERSSP